MVGYRLFVVYNKFYSRILTFLSQMEHLLETLWAKKKSKRLHSKHHLAKLHSKVFEMLSNYCEKSKKKDGLLKWEAKQP